jgi:glycosyltransferase involved in cell wall biosynthesis
LGKKSRLINRILKFLQYESCKFSDVILPVTQAMKDYLIKLNIPEKKLIVILNVPDDTIYNFNTSANNGNGKFKLIYSGSILQRFGVETLVKSLQYLIPIIPNIFLDIYGAGEYKAETEELVKKLNVERYVKFHGRINLNKVPEVIKNTNICIVPILKNSYSELVQTHKMYESIACKKPVVISKINSFLECFKEDQLCYFESGNEKDLAKCIFELYKNPDKRKENVEKAFCQFQNYKWQVTKRLLINLVERMIDNGYKLNY